MKKNVIKRSYKLEEIIKSCNYQIHELRDILGVFHFNSIINKGEISTSPRARQFTKKSLNLALNYINLKLYNIRNGRTRSRRTTERGTLVERVNKRLTMWGRNYRKVEQGQPLESIWVKSESEYKGGRWKTVTHADSWVNIPVGYTVRYIGHLNTVLSTSAARKTSGVVRCHWLEHGRGVELKLVKGFLHIDTGTHATTTKRLKKSIENQIKAQEREARLQKLSDEEILENARKNTKKVPLIGASTSCGNCREGTIQFLNNFNIKYGRKFAKLGAIVRLAKIKGLHTDHYFMRALKYNF